jgi:nickel-dependent lactate racemase
MRVGIHYGLERAEYEVADANLVVSRRQPRSPPVQDIGHAVTNALETPHGFPALRKALTPDDHVVIVVDNRLPHLDEMLTAVVEYLIQARIPPTAITLLYASSPSTGVNGQLPGHPEIAVEIHDASHRKKLSYLATTRKGRRLYLNRTAVDADQLIVLSGRGYDPLLGYSGAVGELFPALCDDETKQLLTAELSNDVPSTEPWPIRREADEAAWLLGAPFMIQVIEGLGKEIVHVLGGVADTAGENERLLNAEWRVTVDRPVDAVVAGLSGDPSRHGFEELARALACAARVVKPRGRIVLLSQAEPTLGAGAQILRQSDEPGIALKDLRLQKPPDIGPCFQWASAADHAEIYMLSRLEPEIAEELFTTPLSTASQAQRLLAAGEVLFLEDAHKSLAVIDDQNEEAGWTS